MTTQEEPLDPGLASTLVAAVRALVRPRGAVSVVDVQAELRSHGSPIDADAIERGLYTLAHRGDIDLLDAAPGSDGLPTIGFRPKPGDT